MTHRNRLWPRAFYPALMLVLPALLWLALGRVSAIDFQSDPVPPIGGMETAATKLLEAPAYAPGEVLVAVRGEPVLPSTVLSTMAESISVSIGAAIDLRGLAAVQEGIGAEESVSGFVLHVPAGEELHVIEQLSASPDVVFAVLNWTAYAADEGSAANPGSVAETPYAIDDDLYREDQWYLQRIGASRAWEAIAANGEAQETLKVAVIDTGVDFSHPEFAGRLLNGRNYISPTLLPHDDSGHGTHVAGVIGAATNNHSGIAGLSTVVDLLPLKVLNADNLGSTLDVADAIRFAADEGADIINLSLAITESTPVLASAVSYASGKGAMIIAAAGNRYGESVTFPAAYLEVMAVAGTTYSDQWAFYNARGGKVELLAPGGEVANGIRSTWASGASSTCLYNSYLYHEGGGYCRSIGTSSAAAVATGAAALLWSIRPELQAFAVRAALRETAYPVASVNNVSGAGRVDVHTAVRRLLPERLQVTPTSIEHVAAAGSGPIVEALRIDNPSSIPISWSVNLSGVAPWLGIGDGTTVPMTGVVSGTVEYGAPAYVPLVMSVEGTPVGSYQATFRVNGLHRDGSQDILFEQAKLSVYSVTTSGTGTSAVYLPQISGVPSFPGEEPTGIFRWEKPGQNPRTVYRMTDNSDFGIHLPFTFTVAGKSYTDTRLFSDGYLLFPAAIFGGAQANRCLANQIGPDLAIYGWWADLNPGGAGEHVSSFLSGADRFVIEFADVPSAASVSPGYRVSFQIVLHRSGRIELNYRNVPEVVDAPPRATVGAAARNGRFYNQIFCAAGEVELGSVPRSYQSFVLKPEELY